MRNVCLIATVLLFVPSLVFAQDTMMTSDMALENSVGIGYGLPYGILGANADLKIIQNLYLTLGMGTVIDSDDIGYNLGLRYFLFGPDKALRPRITVLYGTNTVAEIEIWDRGSDGTWGTADDFVEETEWRRYPGLSAGAGLQWNFGSSKKYGIDLDVFYIVDTDLDVDEIEEKDHETTYDPDEIAFSLGFRINM